MRISNDTFRQLIIGCIDSTGYNEQVLTEQAAIDWLVETFHTEYGHNLAKGKLIKTVCTAYLQGLPSACTIFYDMGEILDWLEEQQDKNIPERHASEAIDTYWSRAGEAMAQMVITSNRKANKAKEG